MASLVRAVLIQFSPLTLRQTSVILLRLLGVLIRNLLILLKCYLSAGHDMKLRSNFDGFLLIVSSIDKVLTGLKHWGFTVFAKPSFAFVFFRMAVLDLVAAFCYKGGGGVVSKRSELILEFFVKFFSRTKLKLLL